MNKNSSLDWGSMHRSKPGGLPVLRGEWTQALPLTEKLSPVDNHSQRKNGFSKGVSLRIQTTLESVSMPAVDDQQI